MRNRLLSVPGSPARLLVVLVALCLIAISMGASTANASIVIRATGSTTVNPIAQASEAPFEALYPDTDLQVNGTQGSGVGQQNIFDNVTEIGMSSSTVSAANTCNGTYSPGPPATCSGTWRPFGLNDIDDWIIARDAISIIVDDDANMTWLTNITVAQLLAIYQEGANITTTYWDSVIPGAPHRLIYPRARITSSGTRTSFCTLIACHQSGTNPDGSNNYDLEQATITATGSPRLTENQDMVNAVHGCQDCIGYVGLGYTTEPGIRVVPVAGITPSVETVQNGTYPLSRVLHMLTLKPSVDPDYTPRIQDYINFMFSKAGQQIVENAGFVSIAPNWDVNVDHAGNISDVVSIGLHWGQSGAPRWIREDANSDGGCNISDVVLVGLHWNATW